MEEIKTSEGGTVIQIPIQDEVRQAYIDYSMSVIVQRALPDVRDGLKPVHRRILYAMDTLHLSSGGKTKKCATIVGEVLGHYHPHGDASVYDALVRLGQDFAQRYALVTPQGNFGTQAGDPAAAYRYTEAKMARLAEDMVLDIDKNTVDMIPNFDDTTKEPSVLPAKFPFLLCNGTTGIAVGMATNMPSHNLREVASAIGAYIENPDISIDELMLHIKGPDFPTGGIIYGTSGFKKAYKTGRGKIVVRAKFETEQSANGRESIVFTEVPYGVNTTSIIKRIKELARERAIDGITGANDETSDRTGMRLVVDLKRGAITKLVLNQLFAKTELQSNFNVINLALVNGKPEILDLKSLVRHFVEHRVEVVTRRTQFLLDKDLAREHILEALITAVDAIDEVIKLIRASRDVQEAKASLEKRFNFDDIQSTAIVEMRLSRLTNLQIEELKKEMEALKVHIAYLRDLLANKQKIYALVKSETDELAEKYGDERRTEIHVEEAAEINVEDMIKEENVVVTISKFGYIKRIPLSLYRTQGRNGKGSGSASSLVEDDFVTQVITATTHSYITFITSAGRAYWIRAHEIPESGRSARGSNVKTLVQLAADEEITAIVVLRDYTDSRYIFMATKKGIVKKVKTTEFANARTRGVTAISFKDADDKLVSAVQTGDGDSIMLVTKKGQGLLIHGDSVRFMGRAAAGVGGIRLRDGDELVSAISVEKGCNALVVTKLGYGKRVEYSDFSEHGRNTGGQRIFGNSEKRGEVVGAVSVSPDNELICVTSMGKTLRVNVSEIPLQSRIASGNKLVNLSENDYVVGFDRIVPENLSEKQDE